MSDVVRYQPGLIEAATSTLTGNVNTMSHQTDDFAHSGQQYVQSGSGQFSDQVQAVVHKQQQQLGEMIHTTQQIISAITEAKASNAARDLRSANSIA